MVLTNYVYNYCHMIDFHVWGGGGARLIYVLNTERSTKEGIVLFLFLKK